MRRFVSNQRGSAMILFAIALVCLLGMAALTIDVGFVYSEKAKLQNIVDATALAGARELPARPDAAEDVGEAYALKNGKQPNDTLTLAVLDSNTVLSAVITRSAPSFFSKVFNINAFTVSAAAKAKVFPTRGYSGIVPIGMVPPATFEFNVDYVMKYVSPGKDKDDSAGDDGPYHGNFHALALDPEYNHAGGSTYREHFKTGYPYPVSIGDQYYTSTGNMVGPTKQALEYRITNGLREVVIPLVSVMEVNGSKLTTVIGFAAFYLQDYGSKGEVIGRFVKMVVPGEVTGQVPYGAYSVSLIE